MNRFGCAHCTVAFAWGGLLLAGLLGCRVTIGHPADDSRDHEHALAGVCVDCGVGHQGPCVAVPCHGRLDDLCHGYESTRWRPLGDYCDDGAVETGRSYPMEVDLPRDFVPGMDAPEELDLNEPSDRPASDAAPPASSEPGLDLPVPMPMPDMPDEQPGAVDADQPMQTRRPSAAAEALFAAVRHGLGKPVAAPRRSLKEAGISVTAAGTSAADQQLSAVPMQVVEESPPHHRSSDDGVRLIHYISID